MDELYPDNKAKYMATKWKRAEISQLRKFKWKISPSQGHILKMELDKPAASKGGDEDA